MHEFAFKDNPQIFIVFRNIDKMPNPAIGLGFDVDRVVPCLLQPFIAQIWPTDADAVIEIPSGFHGGRIENRTDVSKYLKECVKVSIPMSLT